MATKNLLAHRCHNRIYRAIRRGDLDPPYYLECVGLPEEPCGASPCEYDHEWGYRWWFKVVPRCRVCHAARHRRLRKEREMRKK